MKYRTWAKAALIRAAKTFAQAIIAEIGIGAAVAISEIDWLRTFSVALVAAFLSILTSTAGLPEVDSDDGK